MPRKSDNWRGNVVKSEGKFAKSDAVVGGFCGLEITGKRNGVYTLRDCEMLDDVCDGIVSHCMV